MADRAERFPGEDPAVLENQHGTQRCGVHAGHFPSRAVTLPRSSVAVTVAGNVIDS
ncbi:hypothetical protein I553_10131 [Mycobacterium xenopi 4042]|uniref:Uncharacterized protein n=1 Tax=Mycobacterium xenopi 4042 TaxID=1299334 RepID=X7YPN0_MYCXE|nr:hypothetical protein I553_10131 [Mycobacterium xenopi 4042]